MICGCMLYWISTFLGMFAFIYVVSMLDMYMDIEDELIVCSMVHDRVKACNRRRYPLFAISK